MTTGHPTHEEDFDLYALGVLEGDEKRAIESHIAACADCARRLAEARGRIALIGLATPDVPLPPRIRERLMSRIRLSNIAGPAAPENAPRQPMPDSESLAAASRTGPSARWWTAVLAPIGVALAVATLLLWNQNDKLKSQLDNLSGQVHQLRDASASQQKQLEESQHAADLLAAHDTVVVPLAPMPGAPQGTARVAYSPHMGMLMYDGTLAPPPDDKCYQLWLVPMNGGAPINAGVFHPTAGETDHWMMQLPAGVMPKAFAITLEPMGGMPHPTGPKLLAATVS